MVDGIQAVGARIAAIEERFSQPGFDAALARANAPRPPAPVPGPAPAAAAEAGGAPPAGATMSAAGGTSSGEWAGRLPADGQRWAGDIEKAATKAGIEPELLAAVAWAESNFRADARSHAGAVGLTQLMPGTARGLGVDPNDPAANLEGGARYLREQLDRFGSKELALAAYNAGPGRVAQAGGVPRIAETQAYVPKVLDYYQRLR